MNDSRPVINNWGRDMNNTIKKIEDLPVWKEGMRLFISVYKNLKSCNDFYLRDQIQKAAASIPYIIAEGFKRPSQEEFVQYLYIANSSCSELKKHINSKTKSGIIEKAKGMELTKQTRKISGMLHNLIESMQMNNRN